MVVYLDPHRRHVIDWIGKLQHLIGGIPLLFLGLSNLAEGSERPIALLEIAVSSLVIVAFLKEVREARRHHEHAHPLVGWFDLAVGLLLLFETFHGTHHKPFYFRAPFTAAVVTLALGIFHKPFQKFIRNRRYLKLEDDGLEMKAPFRRLKLQWTEVSAVDLTGRDAILHLSDGRHHTINLRMLRNGEAVRRALAGHPPSAALLQ